MSLAPTLTTRSRSRSTSRQQEQDRESTQTKADKKRRKNSAQDGDSTRARKKVSKIAEEKEEGGDDTQIIVDQKRNSGPVRQKRSRSNSQDKGSKKKKKGKDKNKNKEQEEQEEGEQVIIQTQSSVGSVPSSLSSPLPIPSISLSKQLLAKTRPSIASISTAASVFPATETPLQLNARALAQGQRQLHSHVSSSLIPFLATNLQRKFDVAATKMIAFRKQIMEDGGAGDVTLLLNELTNNVASLGSTVTLPQLFSYQRRVLAAMKEYNPTYKHQQSQLQSSISPFFELTPEFTQVLTPRNTQEYLDTLISATALQALPFPILVRDRQLVLADLLLTASPLHVNQLDNTGYSALIHALRASPVDEQLVRYLLNHRADPTIADRDGNTALHHCMSAKNEAVLNLLLQIGAAAAITTSNRHGLTPVDVAHQQGFALDFLSNSLSPYGVCSYVVTKDKTTDQQFYECISCNLTGEQGCCDTCVYRCHRGHVVRKVMQQCSGFCDCGCNPSMCRALSQPILVIPEQAVSGSFPIKLPLPFPTNVLHAERHHTEVKSPWSGQAFTFSVSVDLPNILDRHGLTVPLTPDSLRDLLALMQELVLIRKNVHLTIEEHRKQQSRSEEKKHSSHHEFNAAAINPGSIPDPEDSQRTATYQSANSQCH